MKTAQEVVPTHVVEIGNGSYIMPRYRQRWSKYRQLTWIASSIMARNPGLRLYVHKGKYFSNGRFIPGLFSIAYNRGGMSAQSFETCSDILDGIDIGYRIGRGVALEAVLDEPR